MKKFTLFILIVSIYPLFVVAQKNDVKQIKNILTEQADAWNAGNIENFMRGYWQNDSLMFIGKSGITYGWKQTHANYQKRYPDTVAMGSLNYTILQMKKLSDIYYFVVGKWHLSRSIGDLGGHFTLLFRKIKKQWFIIVDHTS